MTSYDTAVAGLTLAGECEDTAEALANGTIASGYATLALVQAVDRLTALVRGEIDAQRRLDEQSERLSYTRVREALQTAYRTACPPNAEGAEPLDDWRLAEDLIEGRPVPTRASRREDER